MSVINKMLRDLDQRGAPDVAPGLKATLGPGIRSVGSPIGASTRRRSLRAWWVAALLVLAGAGVLVTQWPTLQQRLAAPKVSVSAVPAPMPVVAAAPAMAPAASAPVVAVAESPAPAPVPMPATVTAPTAVAPSAPVTLRTDSNMAARQAAAVPVPTAQAERAKVVAPTPVPVTPVAAATSIATPVATAEPAPAGPRPPQGGKEVLAQAQALWSAGNQDAARELVQEALARAERAAAANPGAAPVQMLVLLVREMARMDLALGRTAEVWDLLSRLEPYLDKQPDMWALRANVAQRLGRHQDSVHAYTVALQSRPDEQRWLLGLAVSLAAMGQVDTAAEMVEKARTSGPISREVLAYLRQMGVPLKDK